jgi:hypothetical protein
MHAHKVFNHLAAPIFAFAVAVQLLDLLVLCFLSSVDLVHTLVGAHPLNAVGFFPSPLDSSDN